jgi:hypothetical protein
MSLPWVRLDNGIFRNPKVLTLLGHKDGTKTIVAYIAGLTFASEQGTDGFIPREALRLCLGRPIDAKRLVSAGLWEADPGGWVIHSWDEYQPSTAETQLRSKRARAAALARWHDRPHP